MASLDEVLSGEVAHVDTADGAIDKGTTEHTAETPEAAPAAVEGAEEGDGAPAAPGHDKTVPLKALEEERKGRQDWKEKAVRFEEQAKAAQAELERLRSQPQQPQQSQQGGIDLNSMDPEQRQYIQRLSDKLDISEVLAREKYPDLNEKYAIFVEAAKANPALGTQLHAEKHPYDWLYKQAAKMQKLAEIGDDPTAYEVKLREKIMAELTSQQAEPAETQTQQPAAQNAALNLPKSLATARSAGPRSAPTWTGPTPLDNILKR